MDKNWKKRILAVSAAILLLESQTATYAVDVNQRKQPQTAVEQTKDQSSREQFMDTFSTVDYVYDVNPETQTAVLKKYTGTEAQVEIPKEIDGYAVTEIGAYCFWNCDGLREVSLPEGIRTIGEEAFACTALTAVRIPDGVTEIGANAFSGLFYEDGDATEQPLELIELPDTIQVLGANLSKSVVLYHGTKEQWDAITRTDVGQAPQEGTLFCESDGMEVTANTISLEAGSTQTISMYTTATSATISGSALDLVCVTTEPKQETAYTYYNEQEQVYSRVQNFTIKATQTGSGVLTISDGQATKDIAVEIRQKPSLQLDQSSMRVYLGMKAKSYHLKASCEPKAEVTFQSSNKKIVTVSSNGVLTPHEAGSAVITAQANGLKKTCKVTVKKPSLKLEMKKGNFYTGSQFHLGAELTPQEAVLSWKSSNKKIATVDQKGFVKLLKPGSVKITATVGGVSKSCQIKVYQAATKASLSRSQCTMMTGSALTLRIKNMPSNAYASFWSEFSGSETGTKLDSDSYQFSPDSAGDGKLLASYSVWEKNKTIFWKQECKMHVIDHGIVQQQVAVAKGSTKNLRLKSIGASDTIGQIKWSTSNASIASVNADGVVKGKKKGTVKISAVVSYKDGRQKTFSTKLIVSEPKLNVQKIYAAVGSAQKIKLSGMTKWSTCTYSSKKKSVASCAQDGTLTPLKTGTCQVKVNVDGAIRTCTVYVCNPALKSQNAMLAPGKTEKIALSGVSKKIPVNYTSKNKGVATVDATGKITAHQYGSTYVKISVAGIELLYLVEVAPQRAIDACHTGESILNTCTYSQEKRMTDGYYDCSSLVFKSYGRDSALLGGSPSWAPTAADMAKHLQSAGKVLAYEFLDPSQMRPGDLIFRGGEDNGRFMGIYHVDLYYGGGFYRTHNIAMIARPLP